MRAQGNGCAKFITMPGKKSKASPSDKKQYCYEHPRPSVSVDVVLFYRDADRAEVLLVKRARDPFKGRWAFPGGFVDEDESLVARGRARA